MPANPLIKAMVRTKFALQSPKAATEEIRREYELTLKVAEDLGTELAARPVRVPELMGIDEDMRDWSVYQMLEHNLIVNGEITRVVASLARGTPYETTFNAKTDTVPSASPGPEQVEAFRTSVEDFLALVEGELADINLRKSTKRQHPQFGLMTAHDWHCMFGFHLMLHRQQAEKAAELLASSA